MLLYLIFGVLTTVVSLAVYYACTYTFLDPLDAIQLQIANVISWVVCVAFAYITNRKYVFSVKKKPCLKECISFYLSRFSTLLMDMVIMFLLVTWLAYDASISKMVAQVVVIIFNYVLSKLLVFR